MGVLIARGHIDKNEAFDAFIQASVSNGLVDKDGEREVRDKLRRGSKLGREKAANDNLSKAKSPANEQKSIAATPFVAVDPTRIPAREWLYDRHYIRKFVSATIAGGGVGKSKL